MSVEIETFDVAYNIIGGGVEGDKRVVRTKEEADHSLPYIIAVVILDDQVMPEQYGPERIGRPDVQSLLRKIRVRPSVDYSRRFPDEMPCHITIALNDGRILTKEKRDYEGFLHRPMNWETVARKFERLSAPYIDRELRCEIIDAVSNLEAIETTDLARLLGKVQGGINHGS
jgi:2-methylcitrate dehydratase